MAEHPNEIRGPIEEDIHAREAKRREKYEKDLARLEKKFNSDMEKIREDRTKALTSAGLNPFGRPLRQERPKKFTRGGEEVPATQLETLEQS